MTKVIVATVKRRSLCWLHIWCSFAVDFLQLEAIALMISVNLEICVQNAIAIESKIGNPDYGQISRHW
ncbi:MAG TPA: hypothetical protein V6C78_06500 [Crinalium sp.]